MIGVSADNRLLWNLEQICQKDECVLVSGIPLIPGSGAKEGQCMRKIEQIVLAWR